MKRIIEIFEYFYESVGYFSNSFSQYIWSVCLWKLFIWPILVLEKGSLYIRYYNITKCINQSISIIGMVIYLANWNTCKGFRMLLSIAAFLKPFIYFKVNGLLNCTFSCKFHFEQSLVKNYSRVKCDGSKSLKYHLSKIQHSSVDFFFLNHFLV